MSRTESAMVELGTLAPPFELVDVISGRALSRDDVFALSWDEDLSDANNLSIHGGPARKHGLLVMFICVHCPYVKHVEAALGKLGADYFADGAGPIAMCAIQSNDIVQYPADGPGAMREQAQRLGWRFPYLLDEDQEVAPLVRRGLHARFLPVQRRTGTRIPRPTRLLPPPPRRLRQRGACYRP